MRSMACCLSIVVGVACSRGNPAYDDPRSSGPETSSSDDGSDTDVTTGSDTGALACELHPDRDVRITVYRGDSPLDASCDTAGPLWLGTGGSLFEPPGDVIRHTDCTDFTAECVCGGTEYTIDFGGTVTVPPGVPTCGPIALWTTMGPEGCEWGGVLIQDVDTAIPRFVVSRTLDVPVPPLNLTLGLEPDETCEGRDCTDPPGRYRLDVLGDIVPADGSPHEVSIELPLVVEALPYLVENRMSSVDEECRPRVAWTALSVEP